MCRNQPAVLKLLTRLDAVLKSALTSEMTLDPRVALRLPARVRTARVRCVLRCQLLLETARGERRQQAPQRLHAAAQQRRTVFSDKDSGNVWHCV